MARLHCEKHKRYVPYCDDCKEIVFQAEEAEARAEAEPEGESPEAASEALEAEVGFPGAEPIPDPWADGKTPAEGDEIGDWKPPADRDAAVSESSGEAGVVIEHVNLQEAIDAGAEHVEIDGGGNVVRVPDLDMAPATGPVLDAPAERIPGDLGTTPDQPPDVPEGVENLAAPDDDTPMIGIPGTLPPDAIDTIGKIVAALEAGEKVAVLIGDNAFEQERKAGRKEVIAWVKEWFADSTDAGAFQLLAHLNKKARQ